MIKIILSAGLNHWLDAKWVNITPLPDVITTAQPAVLDAQGRVITPAVPASTTPGGTRVDPVRYTAYHPTLRALLLSDVQAMGVPLTLEQEQAVDAWVAAYVPAPPPPLDRAGACMQIDADVDSLYAQALGNRAAEYEQAEREAFAYKVAGYTGTAPPMVQSWASAKGWGGQPAADDIIAQAAAWRGAQQQIRAQRLLRKEQVRTAPDDAAARTALAAWGTALAAIKNALGIS